MDAEEVFAILIKMINGVSSGISSVDVDGTTLTFHFLDGSSQTMTFPTPADGKDGKDGENGKDGKDGKDGQDGADGQDGKDGADGQNGVDGKNGVSIISVKINATDHLICTMSDGTVIDAGALPSDGGGADVEMMTVEETLAVLNGGEL